MQNRSTSLWRTLGLTVFWLLLIGVLTYAAQAWLQPPKVQVNASGDLRIERDRDGHFRLPGAIQGPAGVVEVSFLIDTGASTVVISPAIAQQAGLAGGQPVTFQTANGTMAGFMLNNVSVFAGPKNQALNVSRTRVAVGLQGMPAGDALLGMSFLQHFAWQATRDVLIISSHP